MSNSIDYPPGEPQTECALCGGPLVGYEFVEMTKQYANIVCEDCDQRAVNENGNSPKVGREYKKKIKRQYDDSEDIRVVQRGDNPVYIDGQKCWRRYRHGGWVTRLDQYDCDDLMEFRELHNQ